MFLFSIMLFLVAGNNLLSFVCPQRVALLVEHFSEGTRSDWAEVSFIGMEHELKIKAFSYHVMLI